MNDYIDWLELSDSLENPNLTLKLSPEQASYVNSVSIPTGQAGMVLGWHWPWVDVKGQMPKEHELVLIYCTCCGVDADYFDQSMGRWWRHDEESILPGSDVTHWMPLPVAPEKENDES